MPPFKASPTIARPVTNATVTEFTGNMGKLTLHNAFFLFSILLQ